ncbi:WD40-repeat-containing domain protein [Flagelloscypha sp. PMI_526]|nr:WD40-repeat-containing domain protein [Flagelloscypha sp. PMI_526]
MLGPLKMSTEDAKEAYLRLWDSKFLASDQPSERAENLKKALENLLNSHSEDVDGLMSMQQMKNIGKLTPKCKFALTAMAAANLSKPVVLRGYQGRRSSVQCTLLEALFATLSDGQMFPPVPIGQGISELFVATTTGHCNPSEALLEEIPSIFTARSVSVILSIGSGHPSPVGLTGQEAFASAVMNLAKSCHTVSESIGSRFRRYSDLYVRFNVDGMDPLQPVRPGEVISHSRVYLNREDIMARLDSLAHSLKSCPNRLKVDQIFGLIPGVVEKINNAVESVQISHILAQLTISNDAPFASAVSENVQRQSCTPGTRIAILRKLLDWAIAREQDLRHSLFWLYGLAGTGKTTILYDICEKLQNLNLLVSSYFCSIQLSSGDSTRLVPTIAKHLASCSPSFETSLAHELQQDPNVLSAKLKLQFERLLCRPWQAAIDTQDGRPTGAKVVVIDALDECDRGEEFLVLLLDAINSGQLHGIRFIVSSRPVPRLLTKIRNMQSDAPQISLHEVPKEEVNGDIELYLESKINLAGPRLKDLVARADGLFIYASTLVKYLSPSYFLAPAELEGRLEKVLSRKIEKSSIDALYKQIVDTALSLEDEDDMRGRWIILYAIICSAEPPTADTVAGLLNVSTQLVTAVVESLHSVLFTANKDGHIYIFHASFHDFLGSDGCGEFRCPTSSIHSILAQGCLNKMTTSLRFNMCFLESSFIPDADLDPPLEKRAVEHIGDFLSYASRNWWFHIKRCEKVGQPRILANLEQLIREKGIFWIELMSLLDDIRSCKDILIEILAASSIIELVPALEQLAFEAMNLVSLFGTIPIKITSHLYLSSLALSEVSPVLNHWRFNFPGLPRVISQKRTGSRYCQVVINVGASVVSIGLSGDGKRIISGSGDNAVRIWDAESGKQLRQLDGHVQEVTAVAFSPDANCVVSGSYDGTVCIWNAESGKMLQQLEGHTRAVTSVAFSFDGKLVVTASHDETVSVWTVERGEQLLQFCEHSHSVKFATFSPDRNYIISGSYDTACLWSAHSGKILQQLEGNARGIISAAFSQDGTRIFSSFYDKSVQVWDVASGKLVQKLEGNEYDQISVAAFSLDGTRVVSSCFGTNFHVWNALSREELQKLGGHTRSVDAVAFSPNGKFVVSGSRDKTIRIWDAEPRKKLSQLEGHKRTVYSVAFSPGGTRIVAGSDELGLSDNAVRIWDALSGKSLREFEGHTMRVTSVAFSPDGNRVVAGSNDNLVRIWDAKSGKKLQQLKGHVDPVTSVAFSPDGKSVVSGSEDNTVRIWDVKSGKSICQLQGHKCSVNSVSFSPDGKRILSGSGGTSSSEYIVRIWDVRSRKKLQRLEGHYSPVNSVAFSPDGNHVVSGSGEFGSSDNTICIWDANTGKMLRELDGFLQSVNSVGYSHDGMFIVSGSDDKTVCIWDAKSGKNVRRLHGHTHSVVSVAFSSDDEYIVSGSCDNTIRVWDAISSEALQKCPGAPSSVTTVAFSLDVQRRTPVGYDQIQETFV